MLQAFDLFLRAEHCALPLRACLRADSSSLAPALTRVLEARATVEIERVLSARAQLLEIQRLGEPHGIHPIVLKGGVVALGAKTPLDVTDADVLLDGPSEAQLLAKLLDESGYRPMSPGSLWHLEPRGTPEAVHIEIHVGVRPRDDVSALRARAQPIPGFPSLRRLAPPDHAWHVLVHSAIAHPDRRGRLRDVLLLGAALDECSPADLAAVTRRIAEHPRNAALKRMVALARSVGAGQPIDDPFTVEAAANYLLRDRFAWLARVAPTEVFGFSAAVFTWLGSGADRRAHWGGMFGRSNGPSHVNALATMERRWPRAVDVLRRCLRSVRLVSASLLAAPVALAARQIAARSARALTLAEGGRRIDSTH